MGVADDRETAGASTVTFAQHVAPADVSPVRPSAVPASDEALVLQRQEELERQEQVAMLLRFRAFFPYVLGLWLGFGCMDWFVSTFIAPGPVEPVLLWRAGFALALVFFILRLRRNPPISAREFRFLDVAMFALCVAVLTCMGFWYGGVASPYIQGILLTLLVRAVVVAQRWQIGLKSCLAIACAHPAVIAIAAAFSPTIQAQLGSARELAIFAHNLGFLSAAVAFSVIGSHVTWSLRRQVFETRSLGRYRLRQRIGLGGMGEVWAAHDETLKRMVALKILRRERVNEESLQRFQREARATAELTHNHTVRIFDYGVSDDGIWYYAMELLEGETLGARVTRTGPLPPELVRRFAIDLAGALAEAHERGIVHRDIKPTNLFIATVGGEQDVIKLLDFGLAKLETAEEGLTRSGWVGGTPAYISPEAAVGRPVDARSDIYSLGGTLYFALTGTPPFAATSFGALLEAHKTESVAPPASLIPTVPADLEQIILRCLEKSPAQRPRDGAELLALLGVTDEAVRTDPV